MQLWIIELLFEYLLIDLLQSVQPILLLKFVNYKLLDYL